MLRLIALAAIVFVTGAFTLACQGTNNRELEGKVAAQATQIARLEARSEVPVSPGTATVVPTSTFAPTSTPEPITYDRSLAGQTLYIASTGGSGVRLRPTCTDDSAGTGSWREGAAVTVEYGQSDCLGWLKARRGETSAWIRFDYLSNIPPTASPIPPTAVPLPATATPVVWGQSLVTTETQEAATQCKKLGVQVTLAWLATMPGSLPTPYDAEAFKNEVSTGCMTSFLKDGFLGVECNSASWAAALTILRYQRMTELGINRLLSLKYERCVQAGR